MEQIFYICKHCGKIIAVVKETGVPVMCCGQKMEKITPNTVDAATEKHLPKYEVNGNTVTVNVGEIAHPMTKEHLIEWVSLSTKEGNQRKVLTAESEPKVTFSIVDGDEVVAVYAYCNLHGLWKA